MVYIIIANKQRNMAKSIKFKNNNYIDSAGIIHNRRTLNSLLNEKRMIVIADDTQASNLKELMKKKIALAKPYLTGATGSVFIEGGWRDNFYGQVIVSKLNNTTYQAVFIYLFRIVICLENNGNYQYYSLTTTEIT